jgi:hypothetical protein
MLYIDNVYYINVWLRVSTNHMIIFKLFGPHNIQNRNCKLNLGSDSGLILVATQCMAIIFIKQDINIKECLLESSFTETEPPPPHYSLMTNCDEVITPPFGSPYLCQIYLQALEDKTSTHLPTHRSRPQTRLRSQ